MSCCVCIIGVLCCFDCAPGWTCLVPVSRLLRQASHLLLQPLVVWVESIGCMGDEVVWKWCQIKQHAMWEVYNGRWSADQVWLLLTIALMTSKCRCLFCVFLWVCHSLERRGEAQGRCSRAPVASKCYYWVALAVPTDPNHIQSSGHVALVGLNNTNIGALGAALSVIDMHAAVQQHTSANSVSFCKV